MLIDIKLFITFPYYPLMFVEHVVMLPLLLNIGNLYSLFFLICLARGLSIVLMFPKKELFVSLIFSVTFHFNDSHSKVYFLVPAEFNLLFLFGFLRRKWKLWSLISDISSFLTGIYLAISFPLSTALAALYKFHMLFSYFLFSLFYFFDQWVKVCYYLTNAWRF